jgi:DNA-binding CsgD family transcriptional regulator
LGAVEHLKTLCCLGLKPESAMIAVTPLLHQIIPHSETRLALLEPNAKVSSSYSEQPGTSQLYREHWWRLMGDPSALCSLWVPGLRAVGIGWTLHRQWQGYFETAYYRELEAPLDSCWLLDAMIGDGGRSIAFVGLWRPRSARPFNVDDVQRLDRLRPWLAHAFRRSNSCNARQDDDAPIGAAAASVGSGQMILTADAKLVFQTPGLEQWLRIRLGEPPGYTRYDKLPAPILMLLRQITGAANGTSDTPPRVQISTPYGVLTLEAKWLLPVGTLAADAAKDPKSCLISVTVELHEHLIAHAARALRESGATQTQTKVGIRLALGKTKPVIADELGIQLTSVADHTRKLYQTLDVHNSAELATKIWLGERRDEAHKSQRPNLPVPLANDARKAQPAPIFRPS